MSADDTGTQVAPEDQAAASEPVKKAEQDNATQVPEPKKAPKIAAPPAKAKTDGRGVGLRR